MKEKELRERAICAICHKPIGASVCFWVLNIQRHVFNVFALQQQQGLGMMIGGALAQVMGPDEDLTIELSNFTISVCDDCAAFNKPLGLYHLAEEEERKGQNDKNESKGSDKSNSDNGG